MLLFKTYRFDEIDEINPIVGKSNLYLTSQALAQSFRGPIPFEEKYRWQFARKILTFLSRCDWRMYTNESTELSISQKELIEVFGQKYTLYTNWLKDREVVTPVMKNGKAYDKEAGICKSWQFYKKYTQDTKSLVVFTETRGKRVVEFTKDKEYDPRLIETIRNVEINILDAIYAEREYCGLDTKRLHHRINSIFSLWDRRWISKGGKVDRIYHSLSGLSRVTREFLHLDGVRFNHVDVVNCQPLLLAALVKKNGLKVDIEYLQDCQDGEFYEKFLDLGYTRDEAKVQLYKNIFFGIKEDSGVAVRFQKLYPKTWMSINILREGLACRLQNLEAEIFVSITPSRSKGWWPLHDAIYFTDMRDREEIVERLVENFAVYDIRPTFK